MAAVTDPGGSIKASGCRCGSDCGFPCWQRRGIAPACEVCGCQGFDGDE